jgi:energy-coupling factor transporter transmembrane protein EcfT
MVIVIIIFIKLYHRRHDIVITIIIAVITTRVFLFSNQWRRHVFIWCPGQVITIAAPNEN